MRTKGSQIKGCHAASLSSTFFPAHVASVISMSRLNFSNSLFVACSSLGQFFPYPAWVSAAIQNGEYDDFIVSDTVVNSKWKTFGE